MEFIYLKSVPGKLVTRFGTGTLIGAEVIRTSIEHKGRFPQSDADVQWSDDVTAIPKTEYDRYRREYARLIREGSLIEVLPPAPETPAKVSKASQAQKDK